MARNLFYLELPMKATANLRDLGQSLWLDNITRNLLQGGLLRRYIDELSVTGLTANPTIFDHAIKTSTDYDIAILEKLEDGESGEELFFELALDIRSPKLRTATAQDFGLFRISGPSR